MTTLEKKYAVFIPCYNAVATIGKTIHSVQQAVSNLPVKIPVYIYDDCSTDNSYAVCNELIKGYENFYLYKNEHNSGERFTTNSAFSRLAEMTDWIFIIHADDIVKEDWLTTLVEKTEACDDNFFVRGLLAGYRDIYISRTLTLYRISNVSVTSKSYKTNRDLKEIYMLVNKHLGILSRQDVLLMYGTIRKMSIRRMIKWTMRLQPALAFASFKQFVISIIKSYQFKTVKHSGIS